MSDDLQLLQAWQAGDRGAGQALFHRYFGLVKGLLQGKTSDVEELVQRTFEALVQARGRLQVRTSVRAYIISIARHELYASIRRHVREPEAFDPQQVTAIGLLPSASEVVASKAQQRLLLDALRRIPLDAQILLELHYWDEMSTAELAEAFQIPRNTVKTRLRRARQLLEAKMDELSDDAALIASTTLDLDGWARSIRGHAADELGHR
ncbi:MAG: sigma-70 family RNA polymerase sigma factor [Myxococcota bacterium]